MSKRGAETANEALNDALNTPADTEESGNDTTVYTEAVDKRFRLPILDPMSAAPAYVSPQFAPADGLIELNDANRGRVFPAGRLGNNANYGVVTLNSGVRYANDNPMAPAGVVAASRGAAAAYIASRSPAEQAQLMIRTNRYTGQSYAVMKPLAITTDPLVEHCRREKEETLVKVDALAKDLTTAQRTILNKQANRLITITKGRHAHEPRKNISCTGLQKLLYRALEMQAARRAAQLSAQARHARKERHSLMNKGRTVALPDGSTVGYNKRYEKKLASHAIINDAQAAAKAQAKAEREAHTALNKANRVAVAQAHGRKVSRKDLPANDPLRQAP